MVPEWIIQVQDFWKRLNIDGPEDFAKKIHLPDTRLVQQVIPLRDIKIIDALIPMPFDVLLDILREIKTIDGKKVFKKATIEMINLDPRQLKIGQRFVYRQNYQSLVENVASLFKHFSVASGLSELGTYFIFGKNLNGIDSMALYLPPIVERHRKDLVVMDGIHRNYITKQIKPMINSIVVSGVSHPFPCDLMPWSSIKVIDLQEKPSDINERYFGLKTGLFRDLKHLGIDG
ncbi:MAG: hypothetical protein HYW70_00580 [Candidatus Nealsonbacteria bacterium]|nr:hypothetical protein [Candidatus Nealsonbacteria bacterium]